MRRLLLLPLALLMAVTVADSGSSGEVSGTSITLNLTVANTDSLLVVFLEEGGALTDLTWESTSLTPEEASIVHTDGSPSLYYYILTNPATASPGTLEATYGSSTDDVLMAAVLEGVDQTTPIGTATSGESNGDSHSIDVASESGELVLDGFFTQFDRTPYSAGAGQTELVNAGNGQGTAAGARHWGMSHEDGAATVTMSWTSSAFARWVSFGLPIQPATGGGGTTVTAAWTESVAADDSEDGAASLTADLEEGAGARDVLQAAATLTGHATFAAGAQDTMDAAARLTADVTETAGARDGGEDVVATLAASIAEGAQAGEEWATTLVASAETQEAVGPADSFDLPSDAITAALTEDSGAADTFAATLTALAHAVEEAGPEASFETTASLTADYLETVGPGDVWTATASLQAGLTESVGADDTLTLPSEAVAAALTAAIEVAAKVAADIRAQAKTSADLDVEARVDGDIETN